MKHRLRRGFTLIEVMIVVAIVAILAAIAFPSYTQYIQRSYRAEGRNMLLEATQWMEKNYTLTQSYAVTAGGGTMNDAALTAAGLGVVPRGATGSAVRYNITFTAAPTAAAYTLIATAVGAQAADPCKNLTLTNMQARGASGTLPVAECWSR